MTRQSYEPTWPFLCILFCLFILSALTPQVWEQIGSGRSAPVVGGAKELGLSDAAKVRRKPQQQPVRVVSPIAQATPAVDPVPQVPTTPEKPAAPALDLEPATLPALAIPSGLIANKPSMTTWIPIEDVEALRSLLLPTDPLQAELPTLEATVLPQTSPEMITPDMGAAPPEAAEPVVEDAPVVPEVEPYRLWHEPVALLDQLEHLAGECETRLWALDAQQLVRDLGTAMEHGSADALPLVERLAELRRQGDHQADQLSGRTDGRIAAGAMRRAGFALDRRLTIWKEMVLAGGLAVRVGDASPRDPQRLALCLAQVDTLIRSSAQGRAWASYLEMDALTQLARRYTRRRAAGAGSHGPPPPGRLAHGPPPASIHYPGPPGIARRRTASLDGRTRRTQPGAGQSRAVRIDP